MRVLLLFTLTAIPSVARADGWSSEGVLFGSFYRGVRSETLAEDGAGGVLVRVIMLQEQNYAPFPRVGHVAPNGDSAPGWGSVQSQDPGVCSDGHGGAIVAGREIHGRTDGVWVHHISADGTTDPLWPADGLLLDSTSQGVWPLLTPDRAGGAFVVWNARGELRLTRVAASGDFSEGWPADGLVLSARYANINMEYVQLATDALGRAAVAILDSETRLFRFESDGLPATGWQDTGLVVPPTPGASRPRLALASDGGTYLGWKEGSWSAGCYYRLGGSLKVLRITPAGSVDPAWPASGRDVALSLGQSSDPVLVPDPDKGVYVVWGTGDGGRTLRGLRIDDSGAAAAGWPPSGADLASTMDVGCDWLHGPPFEAAADGTGGLLAAWDERRADQSFEVRVRRIRPDGTPEPSWMAGIPVVPDSVSAVVHALGTDGAGGAIVAWWRSVVGSTPGGELRLSKVSNAGVLVPVLVSIAWSEVIDGIVRVAWSVAGNEHEYAVERRIGHGDWAELRRGMPDGNDRIAIEDRTLAPGDRAAYRLSWIEAGVSEVAGEIEVEVPGPLALELALAGEQPVRGEITVSCSLPASSPARLELFDLRGRRLRASRLDPGAGRTQRVTLARAAELPSGVLFVRLAQAGRVRSIRLVVVH